MSTIKIVQARSGFTGPVRAEVVLAQLTALHDQHGALRPVDVVEDARPAGSPLHPCFEWDDDVAAEQYRLSQARNLIRSVEIVHEDRPEPRAAFLHVEKSDPANPSRGAYHPMAVVMASESMRERALRELVRGIESLERSVAQIEQASGTERERKQVARIAKAVGLVKRAAGAGNSTGFGKSA